jgi:hypothetical protein
MAGLPECTLCPADLGGAGRQCVLPEQHLEQGGLAGAVGAEDRHEFTGCDIEVEVVPEQARTEPQFGTAQTNHRLLRRRRGGRVRIP